VDASDILSFRGSEDGYDVNGITCLNGNATQLPDDGLVPCSLQDITLYKPGTRKNGTPVAAPRNNPNNALGRPQNNNTINFAALGFGGVLEARFDYVVFNQPGNDLRITETSFGNPNCTNYPEKAIVSVSLNGTNWTELGEVCLDAELDLGALPYAQYIRIRDNSDKGSSRFNGGTDGYDVDAVVVINNGCNNGRRMAEDDNTATPDEAVSMTLFPNPADDYTVIRFEGLTEESTFRLEVIDAAGRVVKHETLRSAGAEHILQVSDLARGVYHVVISNNDYYFTERLLK
jgi:hypothetical protein